MDLYVAEDCCIVPMDLILFLIENGCKYALRGEYDLWSTTKDRSRSNGKIGMSHFYV